MSTLSFTIHSHPCQVSNPGQTVKGRAYSLIKADAANGFSQHPSVPTYYRVLMADILSSLGAGPPFA